MPSTGDDPAPEHAAEVAIVGGGPAGAAAAVFTARAGLETVVFDAGPSSLRRCAYLENYLGFPAGIDVENFLDLAHAQVERAGATIEQSRVETVERRASGTAASPDPGTEAEDVESGAPEGGFRLQLQDGTSWLADQVVAATRSGADYLRPLDGDAMFTEQEYGGEVHEHFDPAYPDADGRTPVEGLYVASPAGERDVQAIVAAGQGAHVARRLLAGRRAAAGYPDGLDEVYDWLRPNAEFAGEWGTREGWREWFDARLPEDADPDAERLEGLREQYVDDALATRRSAEEIAAATAAGVEELVSVVGVDRVLAAVDDERLREHLADAELEPEASTDG